VRIALILVGRTLPGFNDLVDRLNQEFQGGVTTAFVDFPMTRSFRSKRSQYDAEVLLKDLLRFASLGAEKTVFLVREDIFAGSLNFIFGLASQDGCIVSLARLDPRVYGAVKDMKKANSLFKERILKEVLHELGHTFGLDHCDKRCVMVFSNSIEDVDAKSASFCAECEKNLARVL